MEMGASTVPTGVEVKIDGLIVPLKISTPSSSLCDLSVATPTQSPSLAPGVVHTVTLRLLGANVGVYSFKYVNRVTAGAFTYAYPLFSFQTARSGITQPTRVVLAQTTLPAFSPTSTLITGQPSVEPPVMTVESVPSTTLSPSTSPPTSSPSNNTGMIVGIVSPLRYTYRLLIFDGFRSPRSLALLP